MRCLLVCTLVALMPLSSVRMVCFSAQPTAATVRPSMAPEPSAGHEDEDACTRVCLHRPEARPSACVLVADAACEFLAATPAAVMPQTVTVPFSGVSGRFEPFPAAAYLPPTLDRLSPPPKP